MDCDEVIAVLFRGPFPSGAPTDDAVERHLYECGSCAEIAEGLKPAPDLFHEALTPRENQSLPGYHGSFGCDALAPGFGSASVGPTSPSGALAPTVQSRPARVDHALAEPRVAPAANTGAWVRTAVALAVVGSILVAASGLGW